MGITGERALPRATLQLNYRFSRMGAQGLKFGPDPFPELDALDLYTYVPLDKTVDVHTVGLGFGVTDELTLVASGGWISKSRTAANEDVFFMNETSVVSDLEVDALWQVYGLGAWRAHVQLGVIAPLGSVEERGDFPDASNVQLPYDMQIGTGSWSLVPAIGGQVMNEAGSVGGLIRGIFPLMDNDRDYRAAVKADLRLWGAYRFSDFVSVSGGVRATATEAIRGGLETLRDPGDLGLAFASKRVDLPLGVNLYMASGPLAGHRIGLEAVWTVHEDVDGPTIASDWAFILGWQKDFALPLR